ncbi:hypothetical protein NKY44_08820 [Sinorhizobium meliloti]|uniref:hypothetical protein n=1 Tax=Rhizobium meliloti TaxID=382 RepID=UPI003D6585C6
MARLRPVARAALKRKAFHKPIADYLGSKIEWDNPALKPVKDLIRKLLRKEQCENCPYCQRLIFPERRNMTEHIEHYLDKSHAQYRKFGFTATNLVLACAGCNFEKGTDDLVIPGKAKPVHLSEAEAPFLWPHPYFDDMTASVEMRPGPVYSAIPGSVRETEAKRMIRDLKLDTIQRTESRHGQLVAEREQLYQEIDELMEINTPESLAGMKPLLARIKVIGNELS